MRKLDNIAIIIFGVLLILSTPLCLWSSSVFNEELSRWKAARIILEAGELMQVGGDVGITGVVATDTAVPRDGFAIYDVWELTYGVGESEQEWRVTDSHRPLFDLIFMEQPITIQSSGATLYKTERVNVSHEERVEGIAPGSEITILGTRPSSEESFDIKADIICQSGMDDCLDQLSNPSILLLAAAVVLVLTGLGLIWFGGKRLRR